MRLLEFFYSLNAAISRSVCGVCIVVKSSDSETTMQTPRTLSAAWLC